VRQSKFVPTTYGTIEQPVRCTVDAIIRGAALMAWADGKPVAEERITLAAVLRDHGILELHGEQALLSSYDEAISQRHVNGEWDAAFEHLATLAGNHGAVIAGMTAAHVAVADGVLWPTEVALLRILRERLGISTRPKR